MIDEQDLFGPPPPHRGGSGDQSDDLGDLFREGSADVDELSENDGLGDAGRPQGSDLPPQPAGAEGERRAKQAKATPARDQAQSRFAVVVHLKCEVCKASSEESAGRSWFGFLE